MRLLNQQELDTLTKTWANWAQEAASGERIVSRARLHLFFLLARFGGLRLNEIFSFPECARLDLQSGLLRLADRSFFLPPLAMRPLRRILSLPEAASPVFFRLDAGYVRRSFYGVGKMAGFAPEACAPRALRYGRALELLQSHVSLPNTANMLGLPSTASLSQLLAENGLLKMEPNHFPARLMELETDLRVGKLFLRHYCGLEIQAILPLEVLADIEPVRGNAYTVSISPGLLFPSDAPLPMANQAACEITGVIKDDLEARVQLRHEKTLHFFATIDAGFVELEKLVPGERTNVYFPAHAIKISGLTT